MAAARLDVSEVRRGKFEAADGGTLCLDEIADMSLKTQAKVLRALQEQVVEPVGGSSRVRVDVRVLAATNKDLPGEIRAGRFREDLYFRLSVIPVFVPPLRDREDDLPLLAGHFMAEFAREYGRRVKTIDPTALSKLRAYTWPGNVRELRNVIERLMIMVPGDTITLRDLAFLEGAASMASDAYAISIERCAPSASPPCEGKKKASDLDRGPGTGSRKCRLCAAKSAGMSAALLRSPGRFVTQIIFSVPTAIMSASIRGTASYSKVFDVLAVMRMGTSTSPRATPAGDGGATSRHAEVCLFKPASTNTRPFRVLTIAGRPL